MANGKLRTDEIQLRVVVNGSPARKELAELSQASRTLGDEQKRLKTAVDEVNRKMKEARAAGNKEAVAQLALEEKKLTTEIRANYQALGQNIARQQVLRKEIGITSLGIPELRKQIALLNQQLTHMGSDDAGRAKLEADLVELKTQLDSLTSATQRNARVWAEERKAIQLTDMSIEQLEKELVRLRAAQVKLNPTTQGAQMRAYASDIRLVESRVATLRTGMGPLARMFQDIKGQMIGFGALIGAAFAGGAILSGIKGWITGSAKLSDAQADIQRTTGLTKQEVNELSADLSKFNTRTARAELLALAADAGKLGIQGKDNILQFVRAGDQIRVALGEDLGDDAIKNIGKLNQTFKVGVATGKDMEGQMLATGSAINSLGQSSTAQESFLVGYATRLAGVNTQAKITIQNTLGMGAAIDQLGLQEETASTAMSTFTLKAFKEPAAYAKIAGMAVKDFQELLATDTNEALLRTLEGLKGNNEGLSRMTGLFADMGQEGARAVGVLSSLANNTDLVRAQQKMANEEFAKGTSITNEFNTKNSTLAAKLDIIGKKLYGAFVNSGVVNGINSIVGSIAKLISLPLSEKLEDERIEMNKTFAQILSYNEGTVARTKLIQELQRQYPSFLANINAETVSNDQLRVAVSKLNTQLVNKIILQKKDEEIQEQAEAHAQQQLDVLESEDDVREKMVKLAEKYNLTIKEGVSLEKQSIDILEKIREIRRSTNTTGGGVALDPVARFSKAIGVLQANYAFLNGEQRTSNKLAEERIALLDRLGIKEEEVANATGAPTATDAPVIPDLPETKAENGAREKALEQLRQMEIDLAAHQERMLQMRMTDDKAEIRQLDVKHAEERANLLENQFATEDMVKELGTRQAQELADLIATQGKRKADAYELVEKQIADALREGASERFQMELAHWDALIALAEEKGDDTTELYAQRANALMIVREDELQQALRTEIEKWDRIIALIPGNVEVIKQLEEAKGAAIAAINKKWGDREAADTEDTEARKRAARNQSLQNFVGIANSFGGLLDSIGQYQDAASDKDSERSEKQMKKQRDTAAGIIYAKAAIALATGIAQAMELPYPGNLIAAASTAATVLGLISQAEGLYNQGGSGSSSSNSSNSSSGNRSPDAVPLGEKGMPALPGKSHADGGMHVVDPDTGQVVAEVEGGEALVNKDVTKQNPTLIGALMRAAYRADKRITQADLVGAAAKAATPGAAINTRAINSALRIEHMAAGGVIGNGKNTTIKFTKGQGAANPSGHENSTVRFRKGQGFALDDTDDDTPPWAAAILKAINDQTEIVRKDANTPRPAEIVTSPSMDRSFTAWDRLKADNRVKKVA